jgi:predicted MFS family arabinose efflux permease
MSASPPGARLAAVALMLGNVVTALSVIGPAGMLADLADGLSVSIRDAGLLVTYGAVVLCFGSPLMAWAVSGVARRPLLAAVMAFVSIGLLATAVAPNYAAVMALRIVMLTVGAVFTSMAAGTIAMIVPEQDRARAISFVFLGWALAFAAGLPVVTFVATHSGWRAVYVLLGGIGVVTTALLVFAVPAGLRGQPLSMASWGVIARNRYICWLLFITVLWTWGQFVLFPYIGPLLSRLAGGGPETIGVCFGAMGVMGFVGNATATRIVQRIGAYRTSLVCSAAMFAGTLIWAVGAGFLPAMIGGVMFWGFGFAALNSMQQARLVAAAPALSGATVALNTSANYVGQSLGSALGAEMFSRDLLIAMGYVATALMLLALAALYVSRRGEPSESSQPL